MEFKHKSVLLEETVSSLNIKPDGIYVDGTLGGGGHSLEICKQLSEKGRLTMFRGNRNPESRWNYFGFRGFFLSVRYSRKRIYLQRKCTS